MRKKHAKQYEAWSNKWESEFQQSHYTESFNTTIPLFIAATSVGDKIAEELRGTVPTLKQIAKSVRDEDQYPSLRSQLQDEYRLVNEVEIELKDLTNKQKDLSSRLKSINKKLKNDNLPESEKIDLKIQKRKKNNENMQLDTEIKLADKRLNDTRKNYREKTAVIFDQSQKNEVERLQSFVNPLQQLFKIVDIKSDEFNEAVKTHDPEHDLNFYKANQ